jgi:hypothetical protein
MRSERQRQRRRERKQLKREEKRRSSTSRDQETISVQALPPMGETLLEYAQPLLRALNYEAEHLQMILAYSTLFWNAVRDEDDIDWAGPVLTRTVVKDLMIPLGDACRLTEVLLERRVREFGGDPRTVSDVEVSSLGGRVRVVARSDIERDDMLAPRVREQRSRLTRARPSPKIPEDDLAALVIAP